MIHIERSTDYALIRGILTHPSVYEQISDDCSPPAAEYRPIESEAIWYAVVWDGNELLGLWMLVPQNGICWEIHTALLPHARGARAYRAAALMQAWVWLNTPCRRLITNIPADNRPAHFFAVAAGMQEYGRNEASFLKGGRLVDQTCLGISRPREMPLFDPAHTAHFHALNVD